MKSSHAVDTTPSSATTLISDVIDQSVTFDSDEIKGLQKPPRNQETSAQKVSI